MGCSLSASVLEIRITWRAFWAHPRVSTSGGQCGTQESALLTSSPLMQMLEVSRPHTENHKSIAVPLLSRSKLYLLHMHVLAPTNGKNRREKGSSGIPRNWTHHFHSHPIGPILAIWPWVAAKPPGKCSLSPTTIQLQRVLLLKGRKGKFTLRNS